MPAEARYRIATTADLPQLTSLFDAYRRFYECEPDLEAARSWLTSNLEERRSVILVAD